MARRPVETLHLDPPVAAYIAGLVDGEGCIGINRVTRNDNPYGHVYRGDLSVTMTTPAVLHWLKDQTGFGQVNPKKPDPRRQPTWTWRVGSRQASAILQAILPYLLVKRRQALNFVAFQDACRHTSTKNGLTADEVFDKARRYEISRFLNRRGVGHEPPSPDMKAWLDAL